MFAGGGELAGARGGDGGVPLLPPLPLIAAVLRRAPSAAVGCVGHTPRLHEER